MALAVAALLVLAGRPCWAPTPLGCDPDQRADDPICGPGRTCELLAGHCGPFGFLCRDGRLWRLSRIDVGQCRGCRNAVGGCNPEPCNSDPDCIALVEGCRLGVCRRLDGRCPSDLDCSGAERCVEKRCGVPSPAPAGGGSTGLGPACTSNADCPGSAVCDQALGRRVQGCSPTSIAPNKGCPTGTICVTTGSLAGNCPAI